MSKKPLSANHIIMFTANHLEFQKGSEWRKWDLHIHSPLSILNNQYPKQSVGNPDWDPFLQKLESLDLAVIGITDYYTIEGYRKLIEFKKSGRLSNIHTILPNIEFRLDTVISSRRDGTSPKKINFHVIFSNEVSLQDIEEHFLHDINFFREGSPQNRDERRRLKLSNLSEFGRQLKSDHKNFLNSGRSDLEIGVVQAVVKHEEITDILTKDKRFKGKYLLVFPEYPSCLIDWNSQDHGVRKGILQKSDMVFSSNTKTRQWCLGRDPYTEGEEKYIQEFKTLKPCIHGSDAHRLEDIGHPCGLRGESTHNCEDNPEDCDLRHCWIKADPTFEGLKQLLYEPSDRVIIRQSNPTPVKSTYTHSNFLITGSKINDDLSISETNLPLNSDLVAIAGGKGSGKTAFVDLIANCYMDRCHTEDKNSFVRRIFDDDPGTEVEISFINSLSFKKQVTEQNLFEDTEIVYIAQGQLEKYIDEESDLDKYVNDLVLNSLLTKDTAKLFEFNEIYEEIHSIEESISQTNRRIHQLEIETSDEQTQKNERSEKLLKSEKDDLEKRIELLSKGLSKEKLDIIKKRQDQLTKLKTKREQLMQLKELLSQAKSFLDCQVPEFNEIILKANAFLVALQIGRSLENLVYKDLDYVTELVGSVSGLIRKNNSDIDQLLNELKKYEVSVQEHAMLLDKLKDVEQKIVNVVNKKDEIKNKSEALAGLCEERKELLRNLIKAVLTQKHKYDEIISLFSTEKGDILLGLDFVGQIVFNSKSIKRLAYDILDKRRVEIYVPDDQEGVLDRLISLYIDVLSEENNIDELIQEVVRLTVDLREKLRPSETVSVAQLYDCLWGNYMSVLPQVKYKNTPLNRLSLGQKATVLIKIYLAQGTKPIIIDSHDDHLDNESIMDELVKAIRQAKLHRQIVLASNNGNVVINSDAEQIIIANHTRGTISYSAGSIENPSIRDKALKVLEGGRKAFRARQQKYRI